MKQLHNVSLYNRLYQKRWTMHENEAKVSPVYCSLLFIVFFLTFSIIQIVLQVYRQADKERGRVLNTRGMVN